MIGLFLVAMSLYAGAPEMIAKTTTWVSPLWGYNTPKLVYDGKTWYAAGMRGATPSEGEALINVRNADGSWRMLTAFPGAYQPPTLGIEDSGKLVVVHTRANAPVHLLRSISPENNGEFDTLPVPPGMKNAYGSVVILHGSR